MGGTALHDDRDQPDAVPLDGRGYPLHKIEIDPAFAFDAASLAERDLSAVDPAGDILLEEKN